MSGFIWVPIMSKLGVLYDPSILWEGDTVHLDYVLSWQSLSFVIVFRGLGWLAAFFDRRTDPSDFRRQGHNDSSQALTNSLSTHEILETQMRASLNRMEFDRRNHSHHAIAEHSCAMDPRSSDSLPCVSPHRTVGGTRAPAHLTRFPDSRVLTRYPYRVLALELRLVQRLLTNLLRTFIILTFFLKPEDPLGSQAGVLRVLAERPDVALWSGYPELPSLFRKWKEDPDFEGSLARLLQQTRHPDDLHLSESGDIVREIQRILGGEKLVLVAANEWIEAFEPMYRCRLQLTQLDVILGHLGSFTNLRVRPLEMGARQFAVWKVENQRLKNALWKPQFDCPESQPKALTFRQCSGVFSAFAILYLGFGFVCLLKTVVYWLLCFVGFGCADDAARFF